ncbi:hypothetical protein A2554_03025 [Candidatus Nomurabacteria bacterium RIFOXYD2_FULL_35_12]|uniref:Uncharacterized protein n=2 Tax=Candidatus Nomuraibacteriota TaxID=1752729 RepID=A0A1F6YJS6_9BACT|nr:MAG: hypothetical protein A2192_00790 [Candidatus Nomurabacteria bacterium RIFOXYA1_FULL_35_17]OGJ13964.1 MAG: hypothetical protein A2554_03025 [Candidatus Nomurabacteria bacterium RIFOXYD2_FULL_35_12]
MSYPMSYHAMSLLYFLREWGLAQESIKVAWDRMMKEVDREGFIPEASLYFIIDRALVGVFLNAWQTYPILFLEECEACSECGNLNTIRAGSSFRCYCCKKELPGLLEKGALYVQS